MYDTTSRIADPTTWLQAVRWAIDMHIPGLTNDTMRIGHVLAAFPECRPGIQYLVNKTGMSKSAVCRHLAALRAAGLLVYVVEGGRSAGGECRATVWERVIPTMFDRALSIRVLGGGVRRRMVGIGTAAGRRAIKRLARRVAPRGTRRARLRRRPGTARNGGTPWGSGSQRLSAAEHVSPPERLDGGKHGVSVEGDRNERRPKLAAKCGPNRYRARFRLATELVACVPWLQRTAVPRIAWVTRALADAGWTADLVMAWLDLVGGEVPSRVRRPSGLLAGRIKGAATMWVTLEQRDHALELWRDSRAAAAARHREWDHFVDKAPVGPPPEVADAFARAVEIPRQTEPTEPADADHRLPEPAAEPVDPGRNGDGLPDPDLIPAPLLAEMRRAAVEDPSVVAVTNEFAGSDYARRVYGPGLYARAMHLATSRTVSLHGIGASR
ncbi:helix-turn-helix domain-containing protein [Embleya hyalina]|uniref:helix-turn-helix domain-containing protein n=1 Tax=Embleya hyalina TaxID=516124 RepID=UPI00135A0753|nr:helix-turn-helix domain-containing protein [Embleya hyalina]